MVNNVSGDLDPLDQYNLYEQILEDQLQDDETSDDQKKVKKAAEGDAQPVAKASGDDAPLGDVIQILNNNQDATKVNWETPIGADTARGLRNMGRMGGNKV